MLYCIIIPAACKGVFSHFCTTSVLAVGGAVCYTDNNYGKIQKPQEEMTVKQSLSFARRLAALVLAAVMLCVAVPAAFAEDAAPGATTIGGANTTLIPEEEENCLSWLFGSKDKITLPYLNIKGKGLRRNVSLDLVDCLVGITYTELGSIGSYVSASAAQQAWKAQAAQRDDQARQALAAAQAAAEPHRRAGQALASKPAPAGVDVCAAASADFDAALRAERGL